MSRRERETTVTEGVRENRVLCGPSPRTMSGKTAVNGKLRPRDALNGTAAPRVRLGIASGGCSYAKAVAHDGEPWSESPPSGIVSRAICLEPWQCRPPRRRRRGPGKATYRRAGEEMVDDTLPMDRRCDDAPGGNVGQPPNQTRGRQPRRRKVSVAEIQEHGVTASPPASDDRRGLIRQKPCARLIPIVTESDSHDSQKPTNLNRWRKQEVCDGFGDFVAVRV